jgi:hypothetical protein
MQNRFLIGITGTLVAVTAVVVGANAQASDPQPPSVMERVEVSVSPSPTLAPKALSTPISAPATKTTRKAVTSPPTTSHKVVPVQPTRKPVMPASKAPMQTKTVPVTYIRSYAMCGNNFQHCIDQGSLTLYHNNMILAGHNYMGWSWLDDVPTGRIVKVTYGPKAGIYKVYSHLRLGRQGGAAPSFGSADLVLQTCAGSGTGFSLLHRV